MPPLGNRVPQFLALALLANVRLATAQESPAATTHCVLSPCALIIDWGPGKTAGSYGADQRYGSGDDFEAGVQRGLTAHGVQVRMSGNQTFSITLRPKVNARAMCDEMSGTGTRYNCAVVSDVAVSYASTDATLKPPGALRLTNRCGGERALTMSQFGVYVGEMIWWGMTPPEARERRPTMRC